jgi:LPXTG-motif cell wall-anchored protein
MASVREDNMNTQKIAAIVMIIAGALGLAYGGFSFTKETHEAEFGPLHMTVNEEQQVNVPVWAGIGVIVVGGLLLIVRRKS